MGKAGRALRQVLDEHGISQTQLASALGIGRSNIYRWVNEVRDPNSETVIRIIETLQELQPEAAIAFKKLYLGDR